jgi:PAS domain S-box-containing protein
MNFPVSILHLEDNRNDAELVRSLLNTDGMRCETVRVDTREDFMRTLRERPFDLIISDYSLPSFNGLSALKIAREHYPSIPFLFVSGTIGEESAIESVVNGATDYVLKNNMSRLMPAVKRALRESEESLKRKTAEEMLRKLSRALEQGPSIVLITDITGNIEYVNPKFTEVTGYSAGEVIGRNPRILKSGKLPTEQYKLLWETILSGGEWRGELYNMKKNGEGYWISASVSPVRNPEGSISHFVAVQEDITERKRSEERLREQAALLDIDPDAIYVKDMQDRVQFWSKGAEALYGYTADEVTGRRATEFAFSELPVDYQQALQKVLHDGQWRGEWTQKFRDGREIVVSSRWLLVRDEHGLPKSIYVVNTDITDRRRLEARFLRAQRMDSIGTMAGGIAHDLNNVLSPIMIAVQLLRKKLKDAEDQKMLDMLESLTRRGADMVKHIITFARGIEGKQMLIQPKHLIQEIDQMVRETFPKSIEVSVQLGKNLWSFSGDPTQVNQILINLCINARDAMPKGGVLTVGVENAMVDELSARLHPQAKPGPHIVFSVSDTGTGIPAEIREKIFEPFFTTKEIGKGTGLGLSTSYGIVQSHGGFINVYSEQNKGTLFKIYLPATPSTSTKEAEIALADLPGGRGETVLVIDDEAGITEITKAMLESYGYNVLTAADGAEGVVVCAKHMREIQVVICDMNMPIMDGPATIRAVRKILPNVKVIAVSGFLREDHAAELEGGKEIRLLQKPYHAERLLTVLAEILKK